MNDADRSTGVVAKIKGDYGFIHSDVAPGEDIYFKMEWCKESAALQEGEAVSFEVKRYADRTQARYITRQHSSDSTPSSAAASPGSTTTRSPNPMPVSGRILDWAYLGYLPDVLNSLREMAVQERWEFKGQSRDPSRPFPILHSYLLHTFTRLYREKKIMVNAGATFAAFNTGLVDRRYEPIYALLNRNPDPRLYWKLTGFCVAAEKEIGQNLVRNFNPLPHQTHYFDDPTELLYDVRVGKPEMDWQHIIIDNVDRYPVEFIEDNRPPGVTLQDTSTMTENEREDYYAQLGQAIQGNDRTYRTYMSRLKDALELSIKRVSWNFKTAIPQYYTRVEKLQLLLPLCLVSDDHVDLALAVEKTPSGNYLGHTIFPLHWAYKNARLICRPDSDWLDPQEIIEDGEKNAAE